MNPPQIPRLTAFARKDKVDAASAFRRGRTHVEVEKETYTKGFVISTGVRVSGRSGGICGSFYCANPPQIPRLTAFARKDKVP